jgi:hypothetical protein
MIRNNEIPVKSTTDLHVFLANFKFISFVHKFPLKQNLFKFFRSLFAVKSKKMKQKVTERTKKKTFFITNN